MTRLLGMRGEKKVHRMKRSIRIQNVRWMRLRFLFLICVYKVMYIPGIAHLGDEGRDEVDPTRYRSVEV